MADANCGAGARTLDCHGRRRCCWVGGRRHGSPELSVAVHELLDNRRRRRHRRYLIAHAANCRTQLIVAEQSAHGLPHGARGSIVAHGTPEAQLDQPVGVEELVCTLWRDDLRHASRQATESGASAAVVNC
jgi:hypothetical protein